jgi:hypothetical protein
MVAQHPSRRGDLLLGTSDSREPAEGSTKVGSSFRKLSAARKAHITVTRGVQMSEYLMWGDHRWFQYRPRQLELVSGESIFQRHCTRCGRDFVIDMLSGARHAVWVSILSFYQLHDEVTERWVAELCPGKRLPSDDEDRNKQVAELGVAREIRRFEVITTPMSSSPAIPRRGRGRPRKRIYAMR